MIIINFGGFVMRRCLSILLSLIICFTSLTTLSFPVKAATNSAATKAIDNLQTKSGYQNGYFYGGSITCYTFARKVFKSLFGVAMDTGQNTSTWYSIYTDTMYTVGQLKGKQNFSNVKTLLKKASPGDIVSYRTNNATWTHTAVIESVSDSGITLYHATDDKENYTDYSVKVSYVTWAKATTQWIGSLTADDHGMTLYHAKNYDDVFSTTYKIAYNANGGTGTISTSTVTSGSNFTVAKSGFNRSGYSLSGYNVYRSSDKRWYTSGGWATTSEISSGGYTKKLYALGASYTFDFSWTRGASAGDTFTFYAVWKQSAYNIAFNANGGTGTMASYKINSGDTITIPENKFVREGYYFDGYNCYRQSDGTWYVAGVGWITTQNIKNNGYVKRQYKIGETLTFGSSWTNGASAGDTFTFYPIWKPTNPTLSFYLNYSGANYMSEGIAVPESFEANYYSRDTSLYTVTLDESQGLNNQASIKIVSNGKGSLSQDIAFETDTNKGKEVIGCASDEKAMTLSFWAKGSVDGAKMYWRWGHTADTNTVTITNEWKRYTLDVTKNIYDGAVLYAYLDSAGTYYINNMCLRDSGNEFYKQETGYLLDTIAYEYGTTYGYLPVPEREGYTFLGWFTAKNGGTEITAETQVLPLNTKVYAHWKKDISDTPILRATTEDGTVYELYDNAVSWLEAKELCEKKGGHLVTIDSEEENERIFKLIENNDSFIWIGASYNTETQEWNWVTGEPMNYTNWNDGEPSASDTNPEYYAHMYSFNFGNSDVKGKWNDVVGIKSWASYYSENNSMYICEYNPGSTDNYYMVGDIDSDEIISIKDCTDLQKHISDVDILSGKALAAADCNNDGDVNVLDATFIQKHLVGADTLGFIGTIMRYKNT